MTTALAATASVGEPEQAPKMTMTEKGLTARKVQAEYMSALRRIPKSERTKFKAVAKARGVAAAVIELKKRVAKK